MISPKVTTGFTILSGQEYRSGIYGHLNLYLLEDLVFPGKSFNSDHWPVHGVVGRDAMAALHGDRGCWSSPVDMRD